MTTTELSSDLDARLSRIESLLATVAEESALARRQRAELNELKDELLSISKDAFQEAILELDEVAPFVKTGTFRELGKRLLRNAENFSRLMDLLESTMDLMEDGRPIGRELFNDMLERLDRMERLGHFELLRQGSEMMDRVASAHKELEMDGVEPMSLWQIMKELRSPEVRRTLTYALLYLNAVQRDENQR